MKNLMSIVVMLIMTTMFTCNSLAMDSVELSKYASIRVVEINSESSVGSGCIVSPDGVILTNYHVAGDKKGDLNVLLSDGRIKKAKVLLKGDNKADLALLKIDVTDLPYFNYGDSDTLVKGQEVAAIGFPLSLGNVITFGHITGLNIIESSGVFYILTDAHLNPGNSGGALVDFQGNLIGINTSIVPGANNINYTLPINDLKSWIKQLRHNKKISYTVLGITIGRIGMGDNVDVVAPPDMVGVVVQQVTPHGPAAKAGIKAGDIILDIGGTRAIDPVAVKSYIYHKSPGDLVHIAIYRDGKYLIRDVKLSSESLKPVKEEADEDSEDTKGGK